MPFYYLDLRSAPKRIAEKSRAEWSARLPDIKRRIEAGETLRSIGRVYKCSGARIGQILKRLGECGK